MLPTIQCVGQCVDALAGNALGNILIVRILIEETSAGLLWRVLPSVAAAHPFILATAHFPCEFRHLCDLRRPSRPRTRTRSTRNHSPIHSSFALLPHRAEFTLHRFHTCVGRYDDAATYYSAGSVDTAASVEDGAEHFWMFIFTHLTAIYCFGSSAAMHHFGTHAQASPRQLDLYLKMDYIGISLGMLGPFIPGLTLGFWCHPLLQKWYVLYYCTYCTAVRTVLLYAQA